MMIPITAEYVTINAILVRYATTELASQVLEKLTVVEEELTQKLILQTADNVN